MIVVCIKPHYTALTFGKPYSVIESIGIEGSGDYWLEGDDGRRWGYRKEDFVSIGEWRDMRIDSIIDIKDND